MGWDLPGRKASIFDGGDSIYEAINMVQIGRAVAAVLSSPNVEETQNTFIYVNSFTVTQNQIRELLEQETGTKLQAAHHKTADLHRFALEKINGDRKILIIGGSEYVDGAVEAITAIIYNNGEYNRYSETRGLWTTRLGLPQDDLE